MIVRVDVGAGTVSLDEPARFDRFHVLAPAGAGEAAVASVLGDDGREAGDDHVWVRLSALERWAGDAADDQWRAGFDGMVRYASSKGWLDETGEFVQAHIERA